MRKQREKVYADTMVWIYLSNGTLKFKDVKHLNLYSSINVIHELCTNKMLMNEYGNHVIKKSLRIISQNKKSFQLFPFQHFLEASGIPYYEPTKRFLQKFAKKVAYEEGFSKKINWEAIINKVEKPLEEFIEHRRAHFDNLKNQLTPVHKKEIIKVDYKSYYNSVVGFSRQGLSDFINQQLKTNVKVENLNWEKAELFEHAYILFQKKLLHEPTTLKENDWYDLEHLLYVQPGMKYLTYEKNKGRGETLIRNCGMEKYLVEKPEMRPIAN